VNGCLSYEVTEPPLDAHTVKSVCFTAPVFSSIDFKSTKKRDLWHDLSSMKNKSALRIDLKGQDRKLIFEAGWLVFVPSTAITASTTEHHDNREHRLKHLSHCFCFPKITTESNSEVELFAERR